MDINLPDPVIEVETHTLIDRDDYGRVTGYRAAITIGGVVIMDREYEVYDYRVGLKDGQPVGARSEEGARDQVLFEFGTRLKAVLGD